MNQQQQSPEDGEDSMGKILLKVFFLGMACIVSAWGILKVLESF